jgi:hypothetical protein
MSGNRQKISSEVESDSEDRSVYDFLYNDHRRVGSFLAQFGVGHLQQLTQTKEAERGSERSSTVEGKGGVPGVAAGSIKNAEQTSLAAAEGSVRVYDPLWSNARALLNHLHENELIERDISSAAVGSVVLASGALNIIDLGMIKAMWALPSIQRSVHAGGQASAMEPGNRQDRRAQTKRNKPEVRDPNTELLLEVLPVLPHSLNILLHGAAGTAWGTLDEEHLVGRSSDLVLKHGATISGEWHVLGILDAQPDFSNLEQIIGEQEFDVGGFLNNSLIGQISNLLAPIVQFLLGRPTAAYGITPLMIFREIQR